MTEPEHSSVALKVVSIDGKRVLPEYMQPRKGIYYFKRRVPADVSRLLDPPIEQVWKSLGTGDLVQATKKLEQYMVEFDQMVKKARQKAASSKRPVPRERAPGTTKYLQEAHIPALLERYAFFLLKTDDEERTDIGEIKEKLERRQARKERLALMEEGVAYLDSLDIKDPRLDFHSLRFNFKQQCTHCGIENEVRDALAGHWLHQNPASRGYMRQENRQYPLPPLVDAMAKLRYEELDFSHLYVDDPMLGVTI